MLYFSLYYSYLIYALPVWGGCGLTNIGKMNRINGRIVSIFSKVPHCSFHPAPFNQIYEYFLLCKLHMFIHNPDFNPYFNSKLSELLPVHTQGTRFSINVLLLTPKFNKTTSHNQFFYNSIKHWNNLPLTLRTNPECYQFKKALKKHIFCKT